MTVRPEAVVREDVARCPFDHHSPDIADDPYPKYAELRDHGSVTWSDDWGGFWVVTGYPEVTQVALDDDTFRSGAGVALPAVGQARPLLPIESDPPDFFVYRKLMNARFSPGAARRMEPEIKSIVSDLVDQFIERGEADLARDLAMPLPARTTLRMLGIDDQRWEWFLERIHVGVHESAHDFDRSVEHLLEVYGALAEALEQRQDEGLVGDDLISYLGRAEREGTISEEDILDICLLVVFGGLDTTASAIAGAFYHLDRLPEQRERLRTQPEELDDAIEEFIRYEAPVQALARTVAKETELGGQRMRPGEKVWVVWASANRDPRRFAHPDELDFDREANPHVAFGVGIHRCLGSNLARAMVKAAVTEVLERLPNYRVVDGYVPKRYPDSSVVYGLTTLPVTFPPGEAQGEAAKRAVAP